MSQLNLFLGQSCSKFLSIWLWITLQWRLLFRPFWFQLNVVLVLPNTKLIFPASKQQWCRLIIWNKWHRKQSTKYNSGLWEVVIYICMYNLVKVKWCWNVCKIGSQDPFYLWTHLTWIRKLPFVFVFCLALFEFYFIDCDAKLAKWSHHEKYDANKQIFFFLNEQILQNNEQ